MAKCSEACYGCDIEGLVIGVRTTSTLLAKAVEKYPEWQENNEMEGSREERQVWKALDFLNTGFVAHQVAVFVPTEEVDPVLQAAYCLPAHPFVNPILNKQLGLHFHDFVSTSETIKPSIKFVLSLMAKELRVLESQCVPGHYIVVYVRFDQGKKNPSVRMEQAGQLIFRNQQSGGALQPFIEKCNRIAESDFFDQESNEPKIIIDLYAGEKQLKTFGFRFEESIASLENDLPDVEDRGQTDDGASASSSVETAPAEPGDVPQSSTVSETV